MYIKICGVTNSEDADYAIACGATHIGVIFAAQSKRSVSAVEARQITADVAKRAVVVGVFQNNDLAFVQEVSQYAKLNIVQLHGNEPPSFCSQVGRPVMKALALVPAPARAASSARLEGSPRAEGSADDGAEADLDQALLDLIKQYRQSADYLLFDKPKGDQEPDWLERTLLQLARIQGQLPPYFLAGGLNPGNLSSVFRYIRPYGVDVASGVEVSPRKKDEALIAQFCAEVRAASTSCVDRALLDEAALYVPMPSAEQKTTAREQSLSRATSREEAR